ncbi:two-component regulator propeller domain-containing protein [Paraflavisolibacter sp. H34]|uniref:two-component regulator propeller domain-containing protein n=1 Tax=Huijunlia imazamoxiresistens TaxID=3127457 RepID=UPI00301807EE
MRIKNSVDPRGLFLLFFLLIALAACSQLQYSLRYYSSSDGLSDDRMLSALKDREGFMWFGTWVGLCRFDGYNFKTYKASPGDNSSLKNNRINGVLEDGDGFLWVLADDGQVYRFDKRKETFTDLADVSAGNDLADMQVSSFVSLNKRELWFRGARSVFLVALRPGGGVHVRKFSPGAGTPSAPPVDLFTLTDSTHGWMASTAGLVLLEKKKGAFVPFPVPGTEGLHIAHAHATGETVCFGTREGFLLVYDRKSGQVRKHRISEKGLGAVCVSKISDALYCTTAAGELVRVSFPNGSLKKEVLVKGRLLFSVFEDSKGLLWMAPEFYGIYKYDPFRGAGKFFSAGYVRKDAGEGRDAQVLEDRDGTVWIKMKGKGFGCYNRERDDLQLSYEDFQGVHPFQPTFTMLYYDRSNGILWMTSFLGGIHKLVVGRSPFRQHSLRKENMMREEISVRGLLEDRQGRLWLGTRYWQLNILKDGKELPHLLDGAYPEKVYAILEDRQGTVWMGTKGNGLYRAIPLDAAKTRYRLQRFQQEEGNPHALPSNIIYTLLEDRQGRIWAGSFEKGLILVEPAGDGIRCKTVDNYFHTYPKGAYARVRHLAQDPEGNLWIGTTGGLLLFHTDQAGGGARKFTIYRKEAHNRSSLGDNDVQFIYRDKKDRMWVLTSSGGLHRAVGKAPLQALEFINYSTKNGLRNDGLVSCTEDEQGNLWMGTQNGISRFSPRRETFRNFDRYDGLSQITPMEASVTKTARGEILFGMTTGYISFRPGLVETEKIQGALALTDLQVNHQDFVPGSGNAPQTNINYVDKLVLDHHQNNISFIYTVLDYRFEDKIRYQFRLVGYDTGWQDNRRLRRVTYTNLDPGKYTFEVRGVDPDYYNNIPVKRLSIVINPPFWKTGWAYALYVLLLLALLLVIRRVVTTVLRLRQGIAVERKVAELKLHFFTQVSHEIRTPLSLVINPLEETLKTETLSARGSEYLHLVLRNARRMLRFFNQLLDLRKVQSGMAELKLQPVELVQFLKKEAEYFIEAARQKQISLKFLSQLAEVFVPADPDKLDIVFYNVLSNALKFAPENSSITLAVEKSKAGPEVQIRIIDEGPGVAEDQLADIFTLYYEGNPAPGRPVKGTGIGLALAKELVQLHGGAISAQNARPCGLIVTITLPLDRGNLLPAGDRGALK